MHFSLPNALLVALTLHTRVRAHTSEEKSLDPCTITSTTGSFYDLRPLSISLPDEGKKTVKGERNSSWVAKGYDYPSNFTLNVCAPVVEELQDVVSVDRSLWRNISAYYESGSEIFSLGQQSSNLTLRGRRLVLQYINGSPCGEQEKRKRDPNWTDDENEYEMEAGNSGKVDGSRRKSATISFHCDKDPLATTALATFVSVDPDECAYSFEILSAAACIGVEPVKQGVGPAAVFAIIGVIAVLVYFLGGIFYQRNVAHARGWRQLPNYSMWAGIGSFIKVCGQRSFRRLKYTFIPRVTSVRDGVLPTIEVRALNRRSPSRSSRSSWESGHFT